MNIELQIVDDRLNTQFPLPEYATEGAAAIDLRAMFSGPTTPLALHPGETLMIPTGLKMHIDDPRVAAAIIPRSGLGSKNGVVLGNLVGLIDSDFLGQMHVPVWNRSDSTYHIELGERIAQMMFVPVIRPTFNVVTEFSKTTDRGEGGFGHTGSA